MEFCTDFYSEYVPDVVAAVCKSGKTGGEHLNEAEEAHGARIVDAFSLRQTAAGFRYHRQVGVTF